MRCSGPGWGENPRPPDGFLEGRLEFAVAVAGKNNLAQVCPIGLCNFFTQGLALRAGKQLGFRYRIGHYSNFR